MSYGDGGFFFLQPVNNGYGAYEYTGGPLNNPYGAVVKGEKIGRYTTRYQEHNVATDAERKADIAKMTKFLKKLRKDKTRAKKARAKAERKLATAERKRSAARRGLLTAPAGAARYERDIEEAQGKITKISNWQGVIEQAIAKMQANIAQAQKRPLLIAGDPRPPRRPPRRQAPYMMDPAEGFVGQQAAAAAQAQEAQAEAGPAYAPPAPPAYAPEVPAYMPPPQLPSGALEESFYEKNRTLVLLGAGGVALFVGLKLLRG